eukprot:scaffold286326_cov37-Tisochrysis_lutea.AAC.1
MRSQPPRERRGASRRYRCNSADRGARTALPRHPPRRRHSSPFNWRWPTVGSRTSTTWVFSSRYTSNAGDPFLSILRKRKAVNWRLGVGVDD